MAGAAIGIPSTRGLMGVLTDYGVGAIAGISYNVISNFTSQMGFGGGLLGGAIAAAGVGSVIKGTRGEVLATMLGFQAGIGAGDIFGGLGMGGASDDDDGFQFV